MNIANTTALTESRSQTTPSSVRRDVYGKTLLGEIGALQTRLIADPAELDAAQRLRYRVFGDEMGARFSQDSAATDRDEDRFDAVCDHLIVLDTTLPGDAPDQIVGTYRLLRDEIAGLFQKHMARRAFPLWIGRREMVTDIAFANGAQYRVGERMHAHISVGMAFQFLVMRDFNTAKGYSVSILKSVNVVTMAGAVFHLLFFPSEQCFRHAEIFSLGQFHVVR